MRWRHPWRALGVALLLGTAATPCLGVADSRATLRLAWSSPVQQTKWSLSTPETTYRAIARPTVGGKRARVRISNRYGDAPLQVAAATVGVRAGSTGAALRPETLRRLSFAGARSVTVPVGSERFSDLVALDVAPFDDLAVSLYVPAPSRVSLHAGDQILARVGTTQYASDPRAGDRTADAAGTGFAARGADVYWLDAVEVDGPAAGTVVTLGDSITDGAGAVQSSADRADAYDRYPDVLARRLARRTPRRGVANAAVSGDSTVTVAARLDRDVFVLSGVTHAIVLIGTNDVGGQRTTAAIKRELGSIAQRLYDHGIVAIGGTIPPRFPLLPDREAVRSAVNAWLRSGGAFRSVVDFDAILRDPSRLDRLAPAYDAGDGIHVSPVGLTAMGNAIDLALFDGGASDRIVGPPPPPALLPPWLPTLPGLH